ncbi:MAG: aldo/keto reductase [alpha proteobacterium HIMB59]|nr:MAG: aldo/keto reductase [alpha proteobacterium HIMB59]
MFKLDNKIGLGLAALGRPGYINIGHDNDLGSDKSKASMRDYCHQVLDFAYNNGIRYFDTARVYGDAEEFLSSWIRKQSQFNGFVGSKWGYEYLANWEINVDKHERKDHSAAFLKQQWVETRMNLGKNVDLYHIHSVTPDSSVLDDPTVIKELESIKKSGLEIGISTSGPEQKKTIEKLLKINEKIKLFSFLQSTVNIFEQSCISILKEAHNQKINIIAKEVFSNGLLTNANKDYHQEQLQNLQNIAKEIDLTLEQISYLWVYQLPFIKIILTGASTVSQLQENLNCLKKLNTTIPNLDNLNLSVEDYWSTRKSLSWN